MKSYLIIPFCILSFVAQAQKFIAEDRKPLAVIPKQTTGVAKAVTSLNGNWEINMQPLAEQWNTTAGNWKKIQVPGEPAMQGFAVTNDKEFFYRTSIAIPKDATGKNVVIRFNGVYSYARVFVNGHFVREHFGGFTAWEADISEFAKAGTTATIHVGVTDRADDISYASGYAHHPIGGILREVQLLVLPKQYINRLYVNTKLYDDFKKSLLELNIAASIPGNSNIKWQLYDAKGKPVFMQPKTILLDGNGTGNFSVEVNNPILWNQEQPYLYTLKAELLTNGKVEEVVEQKIGFRKVEVDGKRLLVNGDAVKLRGACRHDMHPLLGRSTNRYYDSLDIILAKQANLNFIRTSHYPPSADFLEFADRYGMYVQEETAICFVNDWRSGVYNKLGQTFNDTAFTSRYLGQLSEMIDRDRNHPAIIMWSIGNESSYGTNFQKSYEFVKSVDLSRPVSWTWPGSAIKQAKKCFDIAVSHYPSYDGSEDENFGLRYKNMEHETMPLLSDEWAHVACYNTTMLKEDPNVKDFWGRSLDTMWAKRFDVPGNLGGAIWGMTDETFHLPDTATGYGPWGFIDVWRREKTEFWNTKKAYSPIKVLKTEFVADGNTISIPVKNRFNHLLLNEVKCKISQGGKSFIQSLPALKPHEEGTISLKTNNQLLPALIQFYDAKNNLIDEELISFSQPKTNADNTSQATWEIEKDGKTILLKNKNFSVRLDATTGQLYQADANGKKVLGGPIRPTVNWPKEPNAFKESTGFYSGGYNVSSASINTNEKNKVTVRSNGLVSKFPVTITTVYFANGAIETSYEMDSIPPYTWQVGVSFPVANETDAIQWKRKGYWTTYPAGHLSATEGEALKVATISETYRTEPKYNIALGMYDYYLTGKINPARAFMGGTEVYRATKENVFSLQLFAKSQARLQLTSDGNQAAKMKVYPDGHQELLVMDKWDYWALAWGNYAGSKNETTIVKGKVVVRLGQ
jgi:hypothetical protein